MLRENMFSFFKILWCRRVRAQLDPAAS